VTKINFRPNQAMANEVQLPRKLKNDAIVEALLEIRFESSDLSPTIVGKLSDLSFCMDLEAGSRLPPSDIPETIREQDPNLRFQAHVERRDSNNTKAIRIGPRVVSVHYYAPYPGWDEIEGQLKSLLTELFSKLSDLKILRLGLRYINIMQSSLHHIRNPSELTLSASIAGTPLNAMNLAYPAHGDENHVAIVKVASSQFVQSALALPNDMAAAIDIDVFTPNTLVDHSLEFCAEWLDNAHAIEKQSFFGLIPQPILEKLIEEEE
jgi:uncharacterized protein (TIGR04255 family)